MIRGLVIAVVFLALAGCGSVSDLEPQAGKSLPQKPALASAAPTSEQLLELTPRAAPKRVDELNKKGEVRRADRFELPPPDSGAAPAEGAREPATPSTTGPDNEDEPRR